VSFIKNPCWDFLESCLSEEEIEIDYVLHPALFVAADATVTCTAFFEDGGRLIRPLDHQTIRFAEETVMDVLSYGLELSDFRERAFKQLLPGLDTWHDGDLVVARDGHAVD
jgi:hypothetical protein